MSNFIEKIFHISPDAASGDTEAALAVAFAMILIGIVFRRYIKAPEPEQFHEDAS
jgi:hypothetical protein